nr:hypothetical protein [uncultured Bacillus sp.]
MPLYAFHCGQAYWEQSICMNIELDIRSSYISIANVTSAVLMLYIRMLSWIKERLSILLAAFHMFFITIQAAFDQLQENPGSSQQLKRRLS